MKKTISVCLTIFMALGMVSFVFANEIENNTFDKDCSIEMLDDGNIFIPATQANLNLKVRGMATCAGDGVKLKSKPGSGGTTLELVYKGEELTVFDVNGVPSGWEYVQRSKTGTKGYMSSKYISPLGPASIEYPDSER